MSHQKTLLGKSILIVPIILFSFVISALCAENLDEIESRKTRRSTQPFYKGADSSPAYYWQSQTMCYSDIVTGHEIWRISNMPEGEFGSNSEEYGQWSSWSADGKRFAFTIDTDEMSAYTRAATGWQNSAYFTMRSDGSKFRVAEDHIFRVRRHRAEFGWSPSEPDTAYGVPFNYAGEGLNTQYIYKATVADDNITLEQYIDLGSTGDRYFYKSIAPDGKKGVLWEFSYTEDLKTITLLPEESKGVDATWNLGSENRNWDTHWGDTAADYSALHNGRLTGNSDYGYWFYLLPDGSHTWWRARLTGSASDGGPEHTQDTTSPYTWWTGTSIQTEMQPCGTQFDGGNDPWCDDGEGNTEGVYYTSHPFHNVDGALVVFEDTEYGRHSVYDYNNRVYIEAGIGALGTTQHPNWNAWSDHAAAWPGSAGYAVLLNASADTRVDIFSTHEEGSDDDEGVNQSPDGTKVAWGSSFLQAGSGRQYQDEFIAVAYYPYPPEITSSIALGGTVRVQFDWRLDQASPRSYTKRGWPDPNNDDPPPPRETEKFRLWRSSDKSTWTPVGTTNANIFTRYDFANGTWHGDSYWEITDIPGDGTFYYAVTALEHSGLEGHTLSNIYRIAVSGGVGTGSQDTLYPANPGGDSKFYTTAPDGPIGVSFTHKESPATSDGQYTIKWTRPANYTMIRYYNIYAEDGATPAIEQQNRIASIPAGAGPNGSFSWVDWLGNPNGSTQYVVTSVDYQGNESGAISADDNENPTVPSILTATAVSSSAIDLSWEASTDNVGVAGYRIYRDGNYIGVSSSAQYSDTGLTPSTEYSYRVSAYDAKGNESAQSSPVSATTQESSGSPETISVINIGDQWKYFKGGSDPGSGWNNVSFDYSSWLEGPTGIGYGDSDDATVLSDMRNNYLTVYTRKIFNISDPSAANEMTMTIDYDDGFVAYINGHEVARSNISGTPSYDSPASGWNEAGTPVVFDLTVYRNILLPGTNVLAIEIHNAEIASSDLSMIPSLTVVVDSDSIPPRDVTNQHKISLEGNSLTLGWTNPTSRDENGDLIPENQDFEGVLIQYNVGDDAEFPSSHTDGTLFGDEPGNLDGNDTFTDTITLGNKYKFAFFTHDADDHYSTTAHLLVDTTSPSPPVNVSPTISSFTGVPSSLNNPGETITFNVSATDPDGDALTYTISFGDGTANGSGSQVVHTYEAGAGEPPHIYTAAVTVSDGHGHSVGQSLQVTVNDIPPAEPTNVSAN